MDPSFVLHASLTCIPIRLLGYIWPDDQKTLLGALLHFSLAPSCDTLKESNEKLCAKTGKDLMYWSIRNGYIEIIHLILSVVGKFLKLKFRWYYQLHDFYHRSTDHLGYGQKCSFNWKSKSHKTFP